MEMAVRLFVKLKITLCVCKTQKVEMSVLVYVVMVLEEDLMKNVMIKIGMMEMDVPVNVN